MQNVTSILSTFTPISLKEMDGVKLMDRMDTKYVFDIKELPALLEEIKPHYSCLHINEKIISSYQTLYYDTKSFLLYNKHHNGELNRYKIRRRTYLDSQLDYLEVKFKNNKGRTIKERIKEIEPGEEFNEKAYDFLCRELPFDPKLLAPVVYVNYERVTLVNKTGTERLTIDFNLGFRNRENKLILNDLVIAEVKQTKRAGSPIISALRKHHIREGSISKYCFAVALLHDGVKKNNFKQKLLSLKRFINYDFTSNNYRSITC